MGVKPRQLAQKEICCHRDVVPEAHSKGTISKKN